MPLEIRGLAPLLQVFDMPRSIAFYRDVLGFKIVAQAPPGDDFDWGLLERDGVQLMLNTAFETQDRPPAPEAGRTQAHADTTLFFGCPDVDAAYAHVKAHGIEAPPPSVAPYGMKQLSLRDPDGYAICFQWPAEREDRS